MTSLVTLCSFVFGNNYYAYQYDSTHTYSVTLNCAALPFVIIIEPTEKSILKAWEFCAEKSRSIEIVYKDDELKEEVLARVHFNVNVNVSFSRAITVTL